MSEHMELKGLSVSTIRNYVNSLEELVEELKKEPESCSAEELKAHLVGVGKLRNLSSSALNIRVCGLKYYFREVARIPELVVSVPNRRVQKYVTDILTSEEIALIFRSCRDMKQKAMIALFFDTGIRVRELIGLRLKDFDKNNRCFTLYNAKGNKIRTLPYSEAMRNTLTSYFLSLGNRPSEWLFEPYGSSGKPMNTRNIQHLIHEITKRSGVTKRVHPHTFRHTFAVHYINNGGSLLRLKELLGHQHLDTTLHYLRYCSIPLKESISPFQTWTDEQKKP